MLQMRKQRPRGGPNLSGRMVLAVGSLNDSTGEASGPWSKHTLSFPHLPCSTAKRSSFQNYLLFLLQSSLFVSTVWGPRRCVRVIPMVRCILSLSSASFPSVFFLAPSPSCLCLSPCDFSRNQWRRLMALILCVAGGSWPPGDVSLTGHGFSSHGPLEPMACTKTMAGGLDTSLGLLPVYKLAFLVCL